ncbi:site-specific integrase [Dyadobacter diqingensis]|uniref:site-specific integrase n=1 Tax=Dyadobacter diqingensis TaxID=2938121 RepID=UPI0020C3B75D|nr:site-specific integrase [Dyadobacter diqingensis]
MKTNFSLLFYLKKQKNYESGDVPVYLRITINSKRAEIATGRQCDPKRWNAKSGRMSGSKEDARSVNAYFANLQQKLFDAHSELVRSGEIVTAESLKSKFLGRIEKSRMLLGIIKEHNQCMEALVGTEYAAGTLKRYQVLERHTVAFLKDRYKASDFDIKKFDIKKIDFAFVADYELYLRTVREMGNNASVKHMKMFRKILNICLNNSWIQIDPFANFKGKYKKVEKVILTQQEIELIAGKEFVSERLSQVRDTFLFCCCTGLAYSDVQKLKTSDVSVGFDGEHWLITQRIKTNENCHIPLLPEAWKIIDQYKNHPFCLLRGNLLPVPSNQKMNEYLKEIAVLCGISKTMTCHVARHTFATVTLQNGVPIETVSKMLGHTNIRTTQIYAKILDIKVSRDMHILKTKLSSGKVIAGSLVVEN